MLMKTFKNEINYTKMDFSEIKRRKDKKNVKAWLKIL